MGGGKLGWIVMLLSRKKNLYREWLVPWLRGCGVGVCVCVDVDVLGFVIGQYMR